MDVASGTAPKASNRNEATCRVSLALQGGGSHGAFTWGVLDRLLEEPDLKLDSVIGTSAGAMNTVVMAHGFLSGGPKGARAALRKFWESIGEMPGLASFKLQSHEGSTGRWRLDDSPIYVMFDLMSRIWSPTELNPGNNHPLKKPLAEQVDFDLIRKSKELRVMVCATNVHTGRRRVFGNAEMTLDAVLASACLPFLFPAVEIDGEPYWDGGYTANPALAPLLRNTKATDVIVVAINPLVRRETPKTARDIINRVTEINFNSCFLLELAAIAYITKLHERLEAESDSFKPMFFHGIGDEEHMRTLGASSKMNNSIEFLHHLHDIGRKAADKWLKEKGSALGKESTVDLTKLLPPDLLR